MRDSRRMDGASPARLYATLVGGALVIGGVAGFFYDSSFEVGDSLEAHDAFGLLAVNAWHNLFHVATGALGLILASTAARGYALGLGGAYLVVALAGIIQLGGGDTDSILQIIPVNTEDNLLHVLLGVLGVAAGLATPSGKPKRPKKPKRERAKREPRERRKPAAAPAARTKPKPKPSSGPKPKPKPSSEKPKPGAQEPKPDAPKKS